MTFTGASFLGGGRACRSASAITCGVTASGYHLLVVDGYSRTKGTPNGECILSGPFRIGGYRWRIKYYPDGSRPEDAGYVSLALFLDEDNVLAEPLKVIHRFSFTNRDRKHESSRTRTESDADEAPREFSARDAWTDRRFVKKGVPRAVEPSQG
ncbi:unnamed protein product [Urochloa humidicola]